MDDKCKASDKTVTRLCQMAGFSFFVARTLREAKGQVGVYDGGLEKEALKYERRAHRLVRISDKKPHEITGVTASEIEQK